jgi:hypothetical protein
MLSQGSYDASLLLQCPSFVIIVGASFFLEIICSQIFIGLLNLVQIASNWRNLVSFSLPFKGLARGYFIISASSQAFGHRFHSPPIGKYHTLETSTPFQEYLKVRVLFRSVSFQYPADEAWHTY